LCAAHESRAILLAPCPIVHHNVTMRPAPWLYSLVLAAAASADIVVTRQAATLVASGGQGTLQQFAPEDVPWSGDLMSGFPFDGYTGSASLTTEWDASHIRLATAAAINEGMDDLVLTQGFVQVDIEFDLTAAATVEVRYDVIDHISVPPPPSVFTTTRVVDLTTIEELHTTPGTYTHALAPGPYRFEIQNMLGNTPEALAFSTSVRSIVGTLRIVAACDIDFNNDDLFPDTQDVQDLLSVFAGGTCPTPSCDGIDFNGDGLFPDTQDIADFLSALAGGPC
jgi:hypothetical protein